MNENEIRIVGILVDKPTEEAENIQRLFSKFGCSIKTRLGLNIDNLNESALMILELFGNVDENKKLVDALEAINGVQLQQMSFD